MRKFASILELKKKFQQVRDNLISRGVAAAWAKSQGGGYTESSPYEDTREGQLAWMALDALKVVDIEEEVKGSKLDYFIRLVDLDEWLAILNGENTPESRLSVIKARRLHELKMPLHYAFAVSITPNVAHEALRIEHLRGVDDLDFFLWTNFVDRKGREVRLEWRIREAVRDALVYTEYGRLRSEAVAEILELLNLPSAAITHIPE